MILADSILQTASMALCVLVAVTATHHTIFNPLVQAGARGDYLMAAIDARDCSYALRQKSSGPKIWRISVSPSQSGQWIL